MYSIKGQKMMIIILWIIYILSLVISVINSYSFFHSVDSDLDEFTFYKYFNIAIAAVSVLVLLYLFAVGTPKNDRHFNMPETRSLFWLNFALLAFSFIVGIANGNDIYYVLGDTYRELSAFIIVFMLIWVYCGLASSGKFDVIVFFIEMSVLVALIASISVFIIRWQIPYLKISQAPLTGGIIWALFQTRRSWLISLPVLIFCTSAGLVSGKRSMLIIMTMIYLIYAFSLIYSFLTKHDYYGQLLKNKATKIVLSLLAIVIIVFTALPAITDFNNQTINENLYIKSSVALVENVFGIVVHGKQDASYESRIHEWENIRHYMDNNPQAWLWGGGQGAEIENPPYAYLKSKNDKMHMVHITWAAIMFRTGLIGILLYLYGYYVVIKMLFTTHTSKYLNWKMYTIVVLMIIVMASLSSLNCSPLYPLAFIAAIKSVVSYDENLIASVPGLSMEVPSLMQFDHYQSDEYSDSHIQETSKTVSASSAMADEWS